MTKEIYQIPCPEYSPDIVFYAFFVIRAFGKEFVADALVKAPGFLGIDIMTITSGVKRRLPSSRAEDDAPYSTSPNQPPEKPARRSPLMMYGQRRINRQRNSDL